MIIRSLLLTFLLAVPVLATDELPEQTLAEEDTTWDVDPTWIKAEKVVIQGLDKVSARVFSAEVKLDQEMRFGSLEIYVKAAYRTSSEDKPESVCFIQIYDNPKYEKRKRLFSGWMFASNPALAALEHPVYDVWLKESVIPASQIPKPAEPAEEVKKEQAPTSDDEDFS